MFSTKKALLSITAGLAIIAAPLSASSTTDRLYPLLASCGIGTAIGYHSGQPEAAQPSFLAGAMAATLTDYIMRGKFGWTNIFLGGISSSLSTVLTCKICDELHKRQEAKKTVRKMKTCEKKS